jgi:CRISPR/Cas system CSM-associated protein Csm5 (group 7 of RAMP superfamily)
MTYVQEFINSNGSHYIPASSVKGALLTILKRESLGIINNIQQKFVINDSPNIPSSEFSVYRTGFGRPPVNLICLNPGTNFQINIQKLGDLSIKTLREKLSSHFPDQITKAKNVVKRFLSQKNLDAGANSFYDILEGLENLTLANDEYLFNLGFGGGSWFKIYSDTPPFKFSNPGKKGKKEEAHTVFLTIDDYTDPIGWCKLKIEE